MVNNVNISKKNGIRQIIAVTLGYSKTFYKILNVDSKLNERLFNKNTKLC